MNNTTILLELEKLFQLESKIQKTQNEILQELQDRRDEGKSIMVSGTLSTTEFTIVDTEKTPGHRVKGFAVKNTGDTNIYIGHNVSRLLTQVDVDVLDALKTDPLFTQLEPNETERVNYNVKCIKNVHLLAVSGTPTFKIKLIW